MKTALVFVRIIIAVSMSAAGMFACLSVEGFTRPRGRIDQELNRVRVIATESPTSKNRELYETGATLAKLGKDGIRTGESGYFMASCLFAVVSALGVLAGNRLKAECRKAPLGSTGGSELWDREADAGTGLPG